MTDIGNIIRIGKKVIPLLLNLFKQYEEDIYSPSKLAKEIHKSQIKISNKLHEKCSQEQNELIYQLKYCMGYETDELVEKAFVYGFCVAVSTKEEAKTCIIDKNMLQ